MLVYQTVVSEKNKFPGFSLNLQMAQKPKAKTKHEIFLKQLKKIPESMRSWDILKESADLEISSRMSKPVCKALRAGETEMIWNRAQFEQQLIDWLKTKPIPEFLLS